MAAQDIYQKADFVSGSGAPLSQLPVRLEAVTFAPEGVPLELAFVSGFLHVIMMSLPPLAKVEQSGCCNPGCF